MSSNEQYKLDLNAAQQALSELLEQREDIETQIAKTKRRIALLAELANEGGEVPDLDLGGLTNAVRTVLRGSQKPWLNTTEIMQGLRALGFPLDKYKAPMASITTTVNRLAPDQVEMKQLPTPGANEYRWIAPKWGAASSLANQMEDARRDALIRRSAEVSRRATNRRKQS